MVWLTKLTPVFALAIAVSAQTTETANTDKYVEHVKVLASAEMQGRGAGTKGLQRASEYIADRFKELKLQPAGEKQTWFQQTSK